MGTPDHGADERWLHGVRSRLSNLGYRADESTTREVAHQIHAEGSLSDAELHAAVGRAEVVRAMQRSLS